MINNFYPLAPEYLGWLGQGFFLTVSLSVITVILATQLGLLLAVARASGRTWLGWPLNAFTAVLRNTPLLVQLFFWYFAVGQWLSAAAMDWLNTPHQWTFFGVTLSTPSFEFLAACCGLIFYSAAFIAEEIRAGIQGVAAGQWQAARALGFTHWQSMRRIILPQALTLARAPLFGQYMQIIKNSSLAMAIGVAELSYQSRQVETETLQTFQVFAIATSLYLLAVMLVEIAQANLAARQKNRAA